MSFEPSPSVDSSFTGVRAVSCSSDLREINEAKVVNILSYLKEAASCEPCFVGQSASYSAGGQPSASGLSHSEQGQAQTAGNNILETSVTSSSSALWGGTAVDSQRVYLALKTKIESLRFQNDDLRRDKEELRRRLEEWRESDVERMNEMRATVKTEVMELRRELAATKKKADESARRLGEEKSQLQCTVESLTSELRKEMASRGEERQKMESASTSAIAALKSKWQAQERAHREKWKLSEAKRIKETTLQSLEPDIVLLLNRHKAEKARMREDFEVELRQRDEVIASKEASVEELKSKLQREAEAVLTREKVCFQERLREETDRVQRQLEEERRNAKERHQQAEFFFEEQKRTLQNEVTRLGREVLELKSSQMSEKTSFHEAVAREAARMTDQSNEVLSNLKDKLMLEFKCREAKAAELNAKFLHTKEEELRKKAELERDQAIAKVVQELGEEHIRALTSARGTDSLLRDRYAQLGRDNERLRVEIELVREQLATTLAAKQKKEEEVEAMREATDLSGKRLKAIEERVRSQYDSKLAILDSEWHKKVNEMEVQHVKEVCEIQQKAEALHCELQRTRNAFDLDRSTMEQKHLAELGQISERVLVTVTRKDSTIQAMRDQLLALQEAIQIREQELQRHRTLLQ